MTTTTLDSQRRRRDTRALADDVEWLLGTDTAIGIARRLGYSSPSSLERVLLRAGYVDLAGRIRVREVRS